VYLGPRTPQGPYAPLQSRLAGCWNKLHPSRFTLPPRQISRRERSIWHEQSRRQQRACQQKGPYEHRLVLDRIKRLLIARAQQGGR
jgi:hypothetical protein